MLDWTRITTLEMQPERLEQVWDIHKFNNLHKRQYLHNQVEYQHLIQHKDLPNPDYIHNWYSWVD